MALRPADVCLLDLTEGFRIFFVELNAELTFRKLDRSRCPLGPAVFEKTVLALLAARRR